jgi:hypothetical protein
MNIGNVGIILFVDNQLIGTDATATAIYLSPQPVTNFLNSSPPYYNAWKLRELNTVHQLGLIFIRPYEEGLGSGGNTKRI